MLLASLLLTGCVLGDKEDPGGLPHRDLAVRPESLPPLASIPAAPSSPPPSASGGATPGATGGATVSPTSGAPSAPGATAGGPSPTGGATAGPGTAYRVVGSTTDGTNDVEGSGPAYGDLVAVTVEDGGGNARVTVVFRGDVPARLPAEETMGVGVDFFRSAGQVESDYQLFADGQPEGWYAYLQTPEGFVRYPGRFGVGGRRLEFTVPWSALGGPSSGRFSAYADWTRDESPVNAFSEDHAPNLGTASFSR